MKAVDAYPFDAVLGTCFVLRNYVPGERVLDTDVDVDALPPYGRLCLSETALRAMVVTMGWRLADPDTEQRLLELEAACIAAEDRYNELADAVLALSESAVLKSAVSLIEQRRAAPREDIDAWMDELPKAGRR